MARAEAEAIAAKASEAEAEERVQTVRETAAAEREKALALIRAGRLPEADQTLHALLGQHPDAIELLVTKASLEARMGSATDALERLRAARAAADIVVDLAGRHVHAAGDAVELTRKEFDLLAALIRNGRPRWEERGLAALPATSP